MTKTSGPTRVLTRRELNRATLDRQLLLRRVRMPVPDAVEHLLGLQAQNTKPPYLALAARLDGFSRDELSELIESRRVVRIPAMRSTVHLMTAADAVVLRPFSGPALERELKMFRKGLTGVDLDELAALAGELTTGGRTATIKEIAERLLERWPDADPLALKIAARARLPLAQVPPRGIWGRGGQVTVATLDSYTGLPLDPAPDAVRLARRYLAAFGPASVQDLQAWCGVTRLRPYVEQLRPELLVFRDENGTELFDLPGAPRPDADTPAPPRFLGEYDNVLLSHADRSRVMDRELWREVSARRYSYGTFTVDGFLRGLWRIAEDGGTATLAAETFTPLTGAERAAVEEEAAGVLRLAAPGVRHDLRFSDV
ncbi:hypothetical protein SRB5_56670 [Streptomyces sp. RB5]|uniref:Winged helix DNA-binding domain-containing protein n=1 Tax=Streptomyces smaragdinus TaxID=2585196 RepID=A0A7K0CPS2_9ACTN|nr:winged helix DNA-binding domain-containing protein [Streptomyces smaragdinus]MQY15485.1 hypothetical protein [Streptomyces smaragdinus]